MTRFRCWDPNGVPLAPPGSYQNGAATFQISSTGTYTVLFEGQNYGGYGQVATVNYTITAHIDPAPTPIIPAATSGPAGSVHFGDVASGTLADQNAIARYSFTLNNDSNIIFNSLTPNGYLTWTLTGPNGYSLSRNFYYSGSYELGGTSPVLDCTPAPTR